MATPRKNGYLQDPDEEMERLGQISSEPVQASDQDDADEKCEELASQYGVQLEKTTKRDRGWYDCNFRG